MGNIRPLYIDTIAEFHRLRNLPDPTNPLISMVRFEEMKRSSTNCAGSVVHNFYSISLKKNFNQKLKYGQGDLNFDHGVMHFMSPKQVLTLKAPVSSEFNHSGWLLLIHPDFLCKTTLMKKIRQYAYFGYPVNQALHLLENEESLVGDIFEKIDRENQFCSDKISQAIIIAQIELLLCYAERFYQRQYKIKEKSDHRWLDELELLLNVYLNESNLADQGIPTVQFIAAKLNVSPNYLSRVLRQLTGQSTQQFIQYKLIDLAKEKLSTTNLSVSEIAYGLGFERPQSFSKLFKSKTEMSPLAFRISFC